jgi:hypothetical protein
MYWRLYGVIAGVISIIPRLLITQMF